MARSRLATLLAEVVDSKLEDLCRPVSGITGLTKKHVQLYLSDIESVLRESLQESNHQKSRSIDVHKPSKEKSVSWNENVKTPPLKETRKETHVSRPNQTAHSHKTKRRRRKQRASAHAPVAYSTTSQTTNSSDIPNDNQSPIVFQTRRKNADLCQWITSFLGDVAVHQVLPKPNAVHVQHLFTYRRRYSVRSLYTILRNRNHNVQLFTYMPFCKVLKNARLRAFLLQGFNIIPDTVVPLPHGRMHVIGDQQNEVTRKWIILPTQRKKATPGTVTYSFLPPTTAAHVLSPTGCVAQSEIVSPLLLNNKYKFQVFYTLLLIVNPVTRKLSSEPCTLPVMCVSQLPYSKADMNQKRNVSTMFFNTQQITDNAPLDVKGCLLFDEQNLSLYETGGHTANSLHNSFSLAKNLMEQAITRSVQYQKFVKNVRNTRFRAGFKRHKVSICTFCTLTVEFDTGGKAWIVDALPFNRFVPWTLHSAFKRREDTLFKT